MSNGDLRVQIDNRIMRPWLGTEDAVYWLNRAEELLPSAEVKIIDLDGSKYEAAEFSDFEVAEFVAEFLDVDDETNQALLNLLPEQMRQEVKIAAEVYFQVSNNLLDRLCRKVEAAL